MQQSGDQPGELEDDLALVRRYAAGGSGGEWAFAQLVKRHVDMVYSSALRQVRDRHLAADVTQAVFIILSGKAGRMGDDVVVAGWLLHATHFAARDALKKAARRRIHEKRAAEQRTAAMKVDSGEPEEARAAQDDPQLEQCLDGALSKLGAAARDALVLRFFEQRSFGEVGKQLGISEQAAKQRVFRGLEKLRGLLARRGVRVSAVALGAMLPSMVRAAPLHLSGTLTLASATAAGAATGGAAAAAAAPAAIAKGAILLMAWTKAKIALTTAVILLLIGGAGVVANHVWESRHREEVVAYRPAAPAKTAPLALRSGSPQLAAKWLSTGAITGVVLDVNGQPAADAEVLLATESTPVSIYQATGGATRSVRTAADGSFTIVPDDRPLAIVARNSAGVAQAQVSQLAASPRIRLEAWARLEGTLRRGAQPLAGHRVHVMRSGLSWNDWHVMHDIEVITDASGHYQFDKIMPGSVMVGHAPRDLNVQMRNYITSAPPAVTTTFDMGGKGQRVVGRVKGDVSDYAIRNLTLFPQPPAPPASTDKLPAPLRGLAMLLWDGMPPMKAWRANQMPIQTSVDAQGNFALDDVAAGVYQIDLYCAVIERGSRYSETAARGSGRVVVADAAPGAKPVDVGALAMTLQKRTVVGQDAPDIKGKTRSGQVTTLREHRGSYVLLHLWWPNDRASMQQKEDLKVAFDHFASDGRLVILGVNRDRNSVASPSAMLAPWPQILQAEVPEEYFATPATLYLIAPDGKLVAKNMDVGEAYARLEAILRPAAADSMVRVERLAAGHRSPGAFQTIPRPSRDNAAPATFRIVGGKLMDKCGPVTCLNDGRLADSDDAPGSAVFFEAGTMEGRIAMDLKKPIVIDQINTYSRHKSTRTPQVYIVYGSDGSPANFNPEPGIGVAPSSCGWTRIASVDTRVSGTEPGGQCGVSITRQGATLGKYRYLLFVTFVTETNDLWGHTFFNEIEGIERK